MHFHLGSDEKRAIAKFCELLRKHNLGPVFEPKFVWYGRSPSPTPKSGTAVRRPSRLRAFAFRFLFQPRQRFRVAHIHPAALNFESRQLLSGGNHRADGIGQFIFAARRFLEARREVKQRWSENVNARVVPDRIAGLEPAVAAQLVELFWRWFFHKPFQAELFVEKIQAALGHVFTARDGDDAGEIAFVKPSKHLRIRFWSDKNVAISQQKRRITDKILCHFRRLARAVLNRLPAVSNPRFPFSAIAEMIFDDFSVPAGDDENVADARRSNAFDDVLEDRLALDAEHGLGQLVGEFPHARALAGGENDGFHFHNR